MLFMNEKENHFKIRSKQKRVGKLYNPVALSLPVFWNSNKNGHDINAWNAAHAPNVFYSGCSWAGLSSAAAQPDLSLSPQNGMYVLESSSTTDHQPLLKKLAWPNRSKAQLLSDNLLTNYPFNTQWLIYLFFILILPSLTFSRWVLLALLPWELCRWMQEVGTCHCCRTSRSQPEAMSCALNIGTWHLLKAAFFFAFAQDPDYRN